VDSLDLLHKSEKGEAFADENPDFPDELGRKCFAPTAKNRLRARGLFSGAEPTITLPTSIFVSVIQESQRSLQAHSLVSGKDWAGYFAIGILL
jgi:hypothetical protein